jgi:SAM-dependent methyltransferase
MKTNIVDIKRYLSDTKKYRPAFNSPIWYVLKKKWDLAGRIDTLFCPEKILDKHLLFISERILEVPFVHRHLGLRPGSRILDFGCTESKLGIELACGGMKVTGVDLRLYPHSCPNFTFLQGDFFRLALQEKSFEAVIAVSAVEHVGLGAYGEKSLDEGADRRIIDRFFDLLIPGGQLILTVPFGSWDVTPFYRIYDDGTLHALLENYVLDCEEYFTRTDFSKWSRTTASELSKKKWSPSGHGADGVALISARRPLD